MSDTSTSGSRCSSRTSVNVIVELGSWPQRMALEEREEVKEHLEDVDESAMGRLDDRKTQVRAVARRAV